MNKKKKYVHYGSDIFIPELFKPIRNRSNWSKPFGGLWASPIDAPYGWKEWNDNHECKECSDSNKFEFILKDDANVLYIDDIFILDDLPKQESSILLWITLDFEKLLKDGYDAIEVCISTDFGLYDKLYGWDCDSILIMNPDIIQIE